MTKKRLTKKQVIKGILSTPGKERLTGPEIIKEVKKKNSRIHDIWRDKAKRRGLTIKSVANTDIRLALESEDFNRLEVFELRKS